jgi:hypothetical protein
MAPSRSRRPASGSAKTERQYSDATSRESGGRKRRRHLSRRRPGAGRPSRSAFRLRSVASGARSACHAVG